MITPETESKPLMPRQQSLQSIVLAMYLLTLAAGFFASTLMLMLAFGVSQNMTSEFAILALVFLTILIAFIVLVIMGYTKKKYSADTIYYNHMLWFINTCWISIGALVVLIPSTIMLFLTSLFRVNIAGWGLLVCLSSAPIIWSAYRVIKGIRSWSAERPVV